MNFPELKACILKLRQHYNARWTLIEDKGAGTSLIQQLKSEGVYPTGINPIGSKIERFSSASAAFEQEQVFFPLEASWLHCLEQELLGFPATKHDDQVDSVSQFLNWVLDRSLKEVRVGTTIGLY